MIESILVYTLLTAVMVVGGSGLAKNHRKKSNEYYISLLIPILAFTFIFGCRYDVGIDYLHYLRGYMYGSERESEPVFRYITEVMSSNGVHYAFYFSLWAFIQISLIYFCLRKYKYIFPFLAFFLIFGSYYMSLMNVMRQQLAACVFLVSIQYIEEKKLIKYVLSILVATIFHRSAWLLFAAYPFLVWRQDWFKNVKIQLIVFFSAVIISMSFTDRMIELIEEPFLLFTDVTGYDDTYRYVLLENESKNSRTQFGNNTGLGIYINILICLPIILQSKKLKEFFNSKFFDIVYTLWFISIIAGFIFGKSIILYRPFVYVVNFRFIMLSFFAFYCKKQKGAFYDILLIGYILIHIMLFLNILSNGEINKARFLFFWDI